MRTPRLELRLPNDEELVELAHLAEQGVHPPEEMPFMTAWTDGIGKAGFVESFIGFHRTQREQWSPAKWHLVLGTWAEGDLVGTQAAELTDAGTAETGSWIGRRHQRRGIGTEMRAAMLSLLFDGIGLSAATSGALDGNVASARVSEKLGYMIVGEQYFSPRGEPVRADTFRLARERWQSPVAVEISGLEPCLPLFGLA